MSTVRYREIIGLPYKSPCRIASTAQVDLFSRTTDLDGLALLFGDRILLAGQSDSSENGIYYLDELYFLRRASDFVSNDDVFTGCQTYINEGTYSGKIFILSSADSPVNVGVTPLVFTVLLTGGGGSTTSGTSGSTGRSGSAGSSGTSGSSGSAGSSGTSGSSGIGVLNYYATYSSTQTQAISSGTSFSIISYDTIEIQNGISLVDGTKVQVAYSGIYEIGISPMVQQLSNGDTDVDIWFRLNGNNIVRSNSITSSRFASIKGLPYIQFIIPLSQGDYIEVLMHSNNAGTDAEIAAVNAQINPSRPAAPSVILDIKNVGVASAAYTSTSGSSGTSGGTGSSGASGSSGSSGTNGITGSSGSSGTNGVTGSSGSSGTNGVTGSSGSSGSSGTNGATGSSGSSGTNGVTGSSGSSGSSGTNGATGTDGSSGSSGTNGQPGSSGSSGDGTAGSSGSSGINGLTGSSGSSGENGSSGSSGTDGAPGSSGSSGDGTAGSSGSSGSSYPAASFGATFDGQGGVITTGSKGYVIVPYSGTLTKWIIAANATGSILVDIRKNSTSLVGAGNPPGLTGAQFGTAAISGWTTPSVTAEDIIEFSVTSASTSTRVNLAILVTKS